MLSGEAGSLRLTPLPALGGAMASTDVAVAASHCYLQITPMLSGEAASSRLEPLPALGGAMASTS